MKGVQSDRCVLLLLREVFVLDWNERGATVFPLLLHRERESKGFIIILHSVCMKRHDHFIFLLVLAKST
jgi:hypothetical protein